jgi:hypothetical protein
MVRRHPRESLLIAFFYPRQDSYFETISGIWFCKRILAQIKKGDQQGFTQMGRCGTNGSASPQGLTALSYTFAQDTQTRGTRQR